MRLIDADALYDVFESTPWFDNADRDIAEELLDAAPTAEALSTRPRYTDSSGSEKLENNLYKRIRLIKSGVLPPLQIGIK